MALPPPGVFPGDWSRPISEIALQFMDAVIAIVEVTPGSGYNLVSGKWTTPPTTNVIWSGIARAQQLAATRGANIDGDLSANPTGTRTYTFQVPLPEDGGPSMKIQRGWYVRVTDGGKDPSLADFEFHIDSSLMSSWRAVQTIVCTVNVEAEPNWQ